MASIIKQRETVIVNQSLATTSLFTYNFSQNLGFVPKYMIIRQLLYCNIAGTDNGTYLIWCNLTSQYIASVYVGIQGVSLTPQTIINLPSNFLMILIANPKTKVVYSAIEHPVRRDENSRQSVYTSVYS